MPKTFSSRPTQDRVKQAIFSSLGSRVPASRVLDLYAGTGSLGIEALSRGAAAACFVEKDRTHAAMILENLNYCRLKGEVITRSVEMFLQSDTHPLYDIILADPPYTKGPHNLSNDPVIVALRNWIHPEGLLVWEHDHRNRWEPSPHWTLLKTADYGESSVSYLRPHAETSD
ncbi:MAG: 16S rRNA (guanine(966)-N(2))-methyltransferase RsmD [Blastochloris sp.]|nr:16S rRNA (guanine(966)-N(2))-methyltransferase RsmD [Blastochloris sp.]